MESDYLIMREMSRSNLATEIEQAAEIIKRGGVGAFPTETVYGLGGDGLNPNAVARIFYEKERPLFDPLILHIAELSMAESLLAEREERLLLLAQHFWPGPLTIIAPKSSLVPDIVSSSLPTVALRMPDNPIALELIKKAGTPLAAPSANKFGRVSPTKALHVEKELPNIDFILDGGSCKVGIESTVIALDKRGFTLLRKGVITAEEIERYVPQSTTPYPHQVASPGMLKAHYSPRKPLYLAEENSREEFRQLLKKGGRGGAFLSFSGVEPEDFDKIFFLSKNSNLKEAAVNLFAILHQLEEDRSIRFMVAEKIEGDGVAAAIRDKLQKGAFPYKIERDEK